MLWSPWWWHLIRPNMIFAFKPKTRGFLNDSLLQVFAIVWNESYHLPSYLTVGPHACLFKTLFPVPHFHCPSHLLGGGAGGARRHPPPPKQNLRGAEHPNVLVPEISIVHHKNCKLFNLLIFSQILLSEMVLEEWYVVKHFLNNSNLCLKSQIVCWGNYTWFNFVCSNSI